MPSRASRNRSTDVGRSLRRISSARSSSCRSENAKANCPLGSPTKPLPVATTTTAALNSLPVTGSAGYTVKSCTAQLFGWLVLHASCAALLAGCADVSVIGGRVSMKRFSQIGRPFSKCHPGDVRGAAFTQVTASRAAPITRIQRNRNANRTDVLKMYGAEPPVGPIATRSRHKQRIKLNLCAARAATKRQHGVCASTARALLVVVTRRDPAAIQPMGASRRPVRKARLSPDARFLRSQPPTPRGCSRRRPSPTAAATSVASVPLPRQSRSLRRWCCGRRLRRRSHL